MSNGSLMKVESIAEYNTFDLRLAIIGLENQFSVFLRVVALHSFFIAKQISLLTLLNGENSNLKCIKVNAIKVKSFRTCHQLIRFLLSVHSSDAIILKRKRKLVALLLLSC